MNPASNAGEAKEEKQQWTIHVFEGAHFTPYAPCSPVCDDAKHHVEVVPLALLEAAEAQRDAALALIREAYNDPNSALTLSLIERMGTALSPSVPGAAARGEAK